MLLRSVRFLTKKKKFTYYYYVSHLDMSKSEIGKQLIDKIIHCYHYESEEDDLNYT